MSVNVPVSTLAVLALHELSAFQSTAVDAQFAPEAPDVINLSRMAGLALDSFEILAARISEAGGDVTDFANDLRPAIKAFHQRTKPQDWHESLMKSYVHNGLIRDFARALTGCEAGADTDVSAVLDDTRRDDYLRLRLSASITDDETLGWRLALWGRKLVFETLDYVNQLPWDEASRQALKKAWSEALADHSRRMSALGLTA